MNIKKHIGTITVAFLAVVFSLFIVGKNTKLHSKISVLEGEKKQMEERIKELADERLEVLDSISSVQIQVEKLIAKTLQDMDQKLITKC